MSAMVSDELRRVLIVDDDAGLRTLLRMTLESAALEVDEAPDARVAEDRIAVLSPDVIVLDIHMPGLDGLSFCRGLKRTPETAPTRIVLLTADDAPETAEAAWASGADAFLRKPFSPLELLDVVERLANGRRSGRSAGSQTDPAADEQLERYAVDLRRLLEIERGQRSLIQRAYREAVTALATALESKDSGTQAHSLRVQRYACELARAMDAHLLDDPSLEYGFLLHDVGKIGIPDRILLKPGSLSEAERRLMRTHTLLGGWCARTTSAGTEVAIRTVSWARRSRPARESSPWQMPSTRSRAIARTAAPASGIRLSTKYGRARQANSTRRSSRRSWSAKAPCGRFAVSSRLHEGASGAAAPGVSSP